MSDLFQRKSRVRTRKPVPDPEHGDWRRAVAHPEDAEHLPTPNLSLFKRLFLRVSYLEAADNEYYLDHLRQKQLEEDQYAQITPIHGLRRVGRIFWGIVILLPLCTLASVALFYALYEQHEEMRVLAFLTSTPVWFTLIGAAALGCLFFTGILRPLLLLAYVFGHEATHYLTSYCFFHPVSSFKVGIDGGYIDTEADNPVVALSPYFVPLWLIAFSTLVWGLNLLLPFDHYDKIFYANFGFWLAFHIYWTAWMIPREQPDFLENGTLFSCLFIGLMNLVMLVLLLAFFDVISLREYWEHLVQIAHSVIKGAFALHESL